MGNDIKGELFLGRYHCLERLGQGPLGETWRARVYGLGGFQREIAVKRLHDRLCADAGFLACFVRAANAAAQLQSDHLCGVQEVDRDGEGRYYLVTDLAPGLSLALLCELLAASGSRLEREVALGLTLDIIDALVYAHGRSDLGPDGVLHLALSPDEVMIDPDGQVRVIGIGLTGALRTPGWTTDPLIKARLAYLAPEVVACRPVGPAADVFSVGAILHQLTGGAPDDTTLKDMIGYASKSDVGARLSSLKPLREALAKLVPDPPGARRRLGAWVTRYAPAPVEAVPEDQDWDAATPVVDVQPRDRESSWNDGLVWESGSSAGPRPVDAADVQPRGAVPEDALTCEVRMPPVAVAPEPPPVELSMKMPEAVPLVLPRIPSPPTLPLAAMRSRGAPRLQWAAAVGGVAVIVIGICTWRLANRSSPVLERAARPGAPHAGVGGGPQVPFDAPATRGPGRLEIASQPAGARVFVDGLERGIAPLALTLDPGRHRLALLAEGRQLHRETLEVGADGRRMSVELRPAILPPELTGSAALLVTCQSRDLRLIIDGVDTGLGCPNEEKLALVPGRHALALYAPADDVTIAVQKEVVLKPERTRRIYLKY